MAGASFSVKRFVLVSLAEKAGAVVAASSFRQVLRNFQVEVKPGLLRLSATDLVLSVIVSTGLVSAESDAVFTVPAKRLIDILREAPEGDVTLEVTETAGDICKIKVAVGGASWDLQVHAAEPFPELPDLASVTFHKVAREPFVTALRAVRHAVSRDGANQALACVTITRDGDGSAKVTACDGARLQQARLAGFPLSMQIPAIGSPSAVDELLRLLAANESLEEVEVGQGEGFLAFRAGSAALTTKQLMVRGKDVDAQLLRPAMANNQRLAVGREPLMSAVRRVRINADPETSAIGLRLANGSLTVVSRDKFDNSASEMLPATWDGGERTVVVHHRFLLEMLAVSTSPEAEFYLGSDSKARRSVLLRDGKSGVTGLVNQTAGRFVGY